MDGSEPIKLKKATLPLVLAIDVGTSSSRALVYDARGRPVRKLAHQVQYALTTTSDGGVYADPKLFLESTFECIDRVMKEIGRHAEAIQGVGLDTFWHNMLGIDVRGRPTTPVISWADTRPRRVIPSLRARLDADDAHARTGCVLHPSYLPAKLLWLYETDRAAFDATVTWMSIGEYLYFVLFGTALCAVSMASGTGLFRQNSCTWDERVLEALPITADRLSVLGDLDTPLRGLRRAYADRWPALAKVPWYPAVGDGASSNVGTGCLQKDQLCLVMGTSGALRACWKAKSVAIPRELWVYRVDKRRFLIGGALSDGGNLRKWLAARLGIGGGKKGIDDALLAGQPDGHGLSVLPFWGGERSTGWHEKAHGLIAGLNLGTTSADLVRAAIESLCYRYAAIHDIIKDQGLSVRQIVASGGGFIDSAPLTQLMSDVMGEPITQSGEAEGSARGTAILALEAMGAIGDASEPPMPLGRRFKPDMKRHAIYARARERQQALYDLAAKNWWSAEAAPPQGSRRRTKHFK
jgi:gluconokinase